LHFILFADDTNVLPVPQIFGASITESVNSELNLVAVWFQVNRLYLILIKTNFLKFRSHKQVPGQSLKVQIDSQQIRQVGLA